MQIKLVLQNEKGGVCRRVKPSPTKPPAQGQGGRLRKGGEDQTLYKPAPEDSSAALGRKIVQTGEAQQNPGWEAGRPAKKLE